MERNVDIALEKPPGGKGRKQLSRVETDQHENEGANRKFFSN
jgi:hypothetical protein